MFGNGLPTIGCHFQAHFQQYFIKRMCKPTKFQTISFDSEHEIPAGALYPDALLDVSLASRNRVLGRTCTFAQGEASGFFCIRTPPILIRCRTSKSDVASCAGSLIHRGRHAHVRSSIHASFIYSRNIKCPAGIGMPTRGDSIPFFVPIHVFFWSARSFNF